MIFNELFWFEKGLDWIKIYSEVFKVFVSHYSIVDPANLVSGHVSLSYSFESNNTPLIRRKIRRAPIVISSSSSHNQNVHIVVRVEKGNTTMANVACE